MPIVPVFGLLVVFSVVQVGATWVVAGDQQHGYGHANKGLPEPDHEKRNRRSVQHSPDRSLSSHPDTDCRHDKGPLCCHDRPAQHDEREIDAARTELATDPSRQDQDENGCQRTRKYQRQADEGVQAPQRADGLVLEPLCGPLCNGDGDAGCQADKHNQGRAQCAVSLAPRLVKTCRERQREQPTR